MDQMTTDELHAILDATVDAAPADWRDVAERAMWYLIGRGGEFSADDLQAVLEQAGISTHEPNAIGALFNTFSRRHYIEFAGSFKKSTRRSSHCRLLRVWRAAD